MTNGDAQSVLTETYRHEDQTPQTRGTRALCRAQWEAREGRGSGEDHLEPSGKTASQVADTRGAETGGGGGNDRRPLCYARGECAQSVCRGDASGRFRVEIFPADIAASQVDDCFHGRPARKPFTAFPQANSFNSHADLLREVDAANGICVKVIGQFHARTLPT